MSTRSPCAITRSILANVFGPAGTRPFSVRLWDGTVEPAGDPDPPFTLIVRRPGALRRMLLPPSELGLAESYLRDDFDIEGNVEAAAGIVDMVTARVRNPVQVMRLLPKLLALPNDDLPPELRSLEREVDLSGDQHSLDRDAAAIRAHYDVGNDFYALWLDERMVYSCAYFPTGTENLDTAQEEKLDLICRKLRLQPGERLLDIGCGWGALVRHAAEHYGVHALGITLSGDQAAVARERTDLAGLGDRCRVEVQDYRTLEGVTFDKVVSVGMYEHVGRSHMPVYFDHVRQLTRPGGLFLNHGIVTGPIQFSGLQQWAMFRLWGEGGFVQKYVFPDGDLLTPGDLLGFAEHAGFETRDLENLREHYAQTLRHWVRRLEDHHAEAVQVVGEQTYRVWRLYMSAYARAFVTARVGICQVLFSNTVADGVANLPRTREDIYRKQEQPVAVYSS